MTWSLLYSRRAEDAIEWMQQKCVWPAGQGGSHEVRYAVPILWRGAS